MFVRQKPNRSGSVSIQVVDKSDGYRVVKTIGSAKDPQEIARLVELGKLFIVRQSGQYSLFPPDPQSDAVTLDVIRALQNASIRTLGPELILGRLFDEIGFDCIAEPLFRDIVVARLAYPTSKAKTVDYLYRYQGKTVSVQEIYRFLDRLQEDYRPLVQRIAYQHSRRVLGSISVVFYDMTSLYFEAEDEDDLRRIGFSKDGKFQNPQIMLGLLVGRGGYPIGYDIFEGNTFEGKTLIPVLRQIAAKYKLGKPVVVADAAMLSNENLDALDRQGYPFIVAARIRNETHAMQETILERCVGLATGQCVEVDHEQGRRLIVAYSDQRARKDAYNRQRGLQRLRKRVQGGRLTKENLNRRGYNKFLKLTGEVTVEIDEAKVEESARWDGLKGYLTNTVLSADDVIENYGQLWHVEKAFRISKTDLRIRPMYHRRRRRIEAHVLVAFVAYAIYKELERRLAEARLPMSPKRAIELCQTMYEMAFTLPNDPQERRVLLKMDPQQQALYDLLH
ncbi:MAG: IS1634 family transposase [Planctomycetes bacterium]|nr:IS1634 family transposase [Planctomycetota bacterium]